MKNKCRNRNCILNAAQSCLKYTARYWIKPVRMYKFKKHRTDLQSPRIKTFFSSSFVSDFQVTTLMFSWWSSTLAQRERVVVVVVYNIWCKPLFFSFITQTVIRHLPCARPYASYCIYWLGKDTVPAHKDFSEGGKKVEETKT